MKTHLHSPMNQHGKVFREYGKLVLPGEKNIFWLSNTKSSAIKSYKLVTIHRPLSDSNYSSYCDKTAPPRPLVEEIVYLDLWLQSEGSS